MPYMYEAKGPWHGSLGMLKTLESGTGFTIPHDAKAH